MIRFKHKFFLIIILAINILVTFILILIQNSIVCAQLNHDALTLINLSFGIFIFMLWALFIIIIYYAKNSLHCYP